MGFGGRIPLPPRFPCIFQSASQRTARRSTAPSATSPKFCRETTTNLSPPVHRIRSGPLPWLSVPSCAACSVCKLMRRNIRSRWRRTFPSDWTSFAIRNVRARRSRSSTSNITRLPATSSSTSNALEPRDCWVEFSPAFSLRSQVIGVQVNGSPLAFKMQPNSNDQHLYVRFPFSARANNLVIRLKNDFGLCLTNELPPLGQRQPRAPRGLTNPGIR